MVILMRDNLETFIKKQVMLKGDTSENLIGLLERRLDAVIYRAKFATTSIFSKTIN